MASKTILESGLREIIEASAKVTAQFVGCRGGFVLSVRCGSSEKVLSSTRGEVRIFSSLNTAAEFLRDRLGLAVFQVDASDYEPGLTRRPRPDRAEALRKTRTRPRQGQLIA
jgi:hypothetical protein